MKGIQWGRIALYAIILEVLAIGIVIFSAEVLEIQPSPLWVFPMLTIFMAFGGYKVAKKAQSQKIAQGALVGILGTIVYALITMGMVINGEIELDLTYWAGHGLKVAGGVFGAYLGRS